MDTIRFIGKTVCVFDCEYVPDLDAGRRILNLSTESDEFVAKAMQNAFGDDRGVMKSVFYKIVSIACVIRTFNDDGTLKLNVMSIPEGEDFDETAILTRFLNYVGDKRPQLVGFASQTFDLAGLWQRSIVNRVVVKGFVQRPAKPWDEYADYFGKGNGYNIDLINIVGNYGSTVPKLEHIAECCRIPAKLGVSGADVAPMWLAGRRREIVDYNECDALTTYLLWLQIVETHGHLTREQVEEEKEALQTLLTEKRDESPHLGKFQDKWNELNRPDGFGTPLVQKLEQMAADVIKDSVTAISENAKQFQESVEHLKQREAEGSLRPTGAPIHDLDRMTFKQNEYIKSLCKEKRYDIDELVARYYSGSFKELNKDAASFLIAFLKDAPTWTDPAQTSLLDQVDTSTAPPYAEANAVLDIVPATDIEIETTWIDGAIGTVKVEALVPVSILGAKYSGFNFNPQNQTIDLWSRGGVVFAESVEPIDLRLTTMSDDWVPF